MKCSIIVNDGASLGIGLENGVDGIILRITDEAGAGAAAGIIDGDLLQSVGTVQCREMDYDRQLDLVVQAKATGVVDIEVVRGSGVAETSLNNAGGDEDLNRTQSYLVANPKGAAPAVLVSLGTITLMKSKGTEEVVVLVRLRETGSFGFGFGTASSGGNERSVHVVATVDHDGVAFDKLHVGDVITTVNQVAVKNMSHGQTNNALVAGGNVVRIGIIRRKGGVVMNTAMDDTVKGNITVASVGGVVMNTAMDDTVKGNITVASVPASVPAASSGRPAIAVGVPGEKWV